MHSDPSLFPLSLLFSVGLSASARGFLCLLVLRRCASPLHAMRAFLVPSRGAVNEPASSVEQPVASNAPSSVEQPAHSFTSIHAVNRWLNAQGDAPSSPELQRLRAAVAVLSPKPKPTKLDVHSVCWSWGVHRKKRQTNRPLATVFAELQQRFSSRARNSAP